MRGRLTYANVAATVALVFAMSGGALAAGHYLINSTRQINPKVLKKLRGTPGARGATGAQGAVGLAGKEGAPGKAGTAGKEGPPGAPASASVAAAFAQFTPASPIEVEESNVLVLQTKTSGKNLELPGAGAHVLVQASVQLENAQAPSAETITCQLAWEALAGGGPQVFGNASTVALEGLYVTRTVLALTGNVSLVGGETYDMAIDCHAKPVSVVNVLSAAINAVGVE